MDYDRIIDNLDVAKVILEERKKEDIGLEAFNKKMEDRRQQMESYAKACAGIEDPEETIPEMIKLLLDIDMWMSTEETFPLMHHGDEERRLKLLNRCNYLLKKNGK